MRSKLQGQELQQKQQKSKFLPMLCSSSSNKEVKLSHRRCSSSSSSVSVSVSEEPSSPRVGCMGQVKRNNKVVGFPSIISFTTSISGTNNNNTTLKTDHHHNSSNVAKYHKLRSFFFTRSLTNSPTTTAATARTGTHKGKSVGNRGRDQTAGVDHNHHHGSTSRISRRSMIDENNNGSKEDQKGGCLVNLEELDPPLPVVKQEEGSNGERINLWKRRSGGAPLKSLQLQAINQSNALLSANTV